MPQERKRVNKNVVENVFRLIAKKILNFKLKNECFVIYFIYNESIIHSYIDFLES